MGVRSRGCYLLEFEHIVQINDFGDSSLSVLTRSQLWQGLVLRAHSPDKFVQGLQCTSEQISSNEFMRTVQAGTSSFRESVILYPQEKICTRTITDTTQISAESTTRIEEPEAGSLFVRFSYRRDLDGPDQRVDVSEHLKAAYVQVDRDAIAMIRMLAESRQFAQLIN